MTTAQANETWDSLGEVVQLLHRAARLVWNVADHHEATSPLKSLGMGVFLAAGQATALLPESWDLHILGLDDDQRSPLQLLQAAEALTRSPSLHPGLVEGLSPLVVDVCDLIREARDLGY